MINVTDKILHSRRVRGKDCTLIKLASGVIAVKRGLEILYYGEQGELIAPNRISEQDIDEARTRLYKNINKKGW